MEKKIFLKAIVLVFSCNLFSDITAQVGINTPNPQAVFHIDGQKNNPTTGIPTVIQQADDVAVSSSGNVGLGTNTPSSKLEIQTGGTVATPISGLKIVDGSQTDQYVLTSDASGSALWKPITLTTIMGVFPTSTGAGNYTFKTTTLWDKTNAFITLPPGRWRVDVTQLLRITGDAITGDQYMWLRFSFTDDNTPTNPTLTNDFTTNARYISAQISGPTVSITNVYKYALAQGSVLINNSSGTSKNYYLIVGSSTSSFTSTTTYLQSVGGNTWGENIITAIPISQ